MGDREKIDRLAEKRHRQALSQIPLMGRPDAIDDMSYKGSNALANFDFKEAKKMFDAALALDPGNVKSNMNKGYLSGIAGDLKGAAEAFDRALAADPGNYRANINRGIQHENDGQFDEAMARYDRAHKEKPDVPEPLIFKGCMLGERGRHEEALEYFKKALEVDPTSFSAKLGIVTSFKNLGRMEEAAQAHRELSRSNTFKEKTEMTMMMLDEMHIGKDLKEHIGAIMESVSEEVDRTLLKMPGSKDDCGKGNPSPQEP